MTERDIAHPIDAAYSKVLSTIPVEDLRVIDARVEREQVLLSTGEGKKLLAEPKNNRRFRRPLIRKPKKMRPARKAFFSSAAFVTVFGGGLATAIHEDITVNAEKDIQIAAITRKYERVTHPTISEYRANMEILKLAKEAKKSGAPPLVDAQEIAEAIVENSRYQDHMEQKKAEIQDAQDQAKDKLTGNPKIIIGGSAGGILLFGVMASPALLIASGRRRQPPNTQ